MKIIGLTGNSGSGKSTVAEYFKEKHHAYIIDADKVGHQILKKESPAFDELISIFGEEMKDEKGDISRPLLRKMVFDDQEKLMQLNKISHYYITKQILDEISVIKQYDNQPYSAIIIDAALLLQSEIKNYVDLVWVVLSDEGHQLDRLKSRDHLSSEDIKRRLASQWKNEDFLPYADEVIYNKTNLDDLYEACDRLYEKYLAI